MKAYIRRTASVIALALVAGSVNSAFAQETTAQDQPPAPETIQTAQADINNAPTDRVTITGSRVASGADAPTPVTAVSTDAINQIALPNIADALIQLPAMRTSVTSAKGGQGLTIGSQLNLRNIGSFRTLVLVDGKRFVSTAPFGAGQSIAVNIDAIPQGLIRQVDTVTGGASAAYGSDAVAGVVNFILDHDFEGIKAEVIYGQTQRRDGIRYGGELDFGGKFADGRGHILASLEYNRDEGIQNDPYGFNGARDWQNTPIGREARGAGLAIVDDARFPMQPLNGLVLGCRTATTALNYTNCPVFGTSFNDDGTATQAYDFGLRATQPSATSPGSTFAVGGDGYNPGPQSLLSTPTIRNSMFLRADYDFSDKLNVYVEANSARTKSRSEAGSGTSTFANANPLGFTLNRNYAYLPANLAASMDANNLTSISLQKYFAFNVKQTFESRTNRIVTGATYDFDDNWTGDIYYTYGETKSQMTLNDFSDTIAMANSLTAVRDPVSGAVTCATGGQYCVPWNVFGRQALSPELNKYINPTNQYFNENTQQALEATVTGTAFELPAGPVDVAVGGGYRKETLEESTDALGLAAKRNGFNGNPGGLIYINSPAISGDLELFEGFGEAQVPLLSDLPFIDKLDANFAARYTDYSSSGGVTTWKAGLVWQPLEGLRIRAAQSRDIRAANLVELYNPQSTGFANLLDPQKGGQSVSFVPITSGNPELDPEEAETTTVGFVWNPSFFPQFTASVDYFNIQMEGAISTINAQRTVELCQASINNPSTYGSYTAFCGRITRDSNGNLLSVATPYGNLAQLENRGIDIELGYNEDLPVFGIDGRLSLRAFATYVYENSTTTPGLPAIAVDIAPSIGQLAGLLTASYMFDDWTIGLQQTFIGHGTFDPSLYTATGQRRRYVGDQAPSMTWTDLSVKKAFGDWEVFGSVQNLFDKDPPRVPFTGTSSGFGTSNIYDTQGRRYMMGARIRM
jgi:iron complex outermembrane recepter protein